MLHELMQKKNLAKNLSENCGLGSIPAFENRESWENLPESAKRYFRETADELKGKRHIALPATLYMDFARIGDRSKYESVYFQRRADLMALAIAECVQAKGEYIDPIIDLLWAICEETSWVVPAHNDGGELPDVEKRVYIDLFSAETGAAISIAYHLLGEIIAKASPIVKRRMELEIEKRIISPYLNYSYNWSGFDGQPVNNWNPWINSNILLAFAVFEKDSARLVQGVEKTAKSIDAFINGYKPDGACDEGPSYFGVAGASMFDYLETLSDMIGGDIGVYDDELIKNMARYIYRVHIDADYFVNFADCPVRVGAPAKLLMRVGEAIKDENLMGFASEMLSDSSKTRALGYHTVYRNIKSMFQKEEYAGKKFAPPKVHWFAETQILTARDSERTKAGIFVAAKGGNNAESHNHNDVGHFILYSGGKPVVVDAGVETYTKKTFSPRRYDIWTMQSCHHNLPTINGHDQTAGPKGADQVKYAHENNVTTLSMQLKGAYPEDAKIESYVREFVFEHGKSLSVRDRYSLKRCEAPLVYNLMCANRPTICGDKILLGENAEMFFESADFDAGVEEIELTDARLRGEWRQDYLYRLQLTEKEMKNEGKITVNFRVNKCN